MRFDALDWEVPMPVAFLRLIGRTVFALVLGIASAGAAPILADDFEGLARYDRARGASFVIAAMLAPRGINGSDGFGAFFRTAPGNDYLVPGNALTDIADGSPSGFSGVLYDLDSLDIPHDAVALRIRFDHAFRTVPERFQVDVFRVLLGSATCLETRTAFQGQADCRVGIQPENALAFSLAELTGHR